MKGLEKFTSIRLAEVLTQKGAVSTEVITDALYAQDRRNQSFVEVLVNGGHITEWDLAKLVVEAFQLPFIMAGNHEVSDETKSLLPKDLVFRGLIVPLDVFDKILTVSMPILVGPEIINKIQRDHGYKVFPYVGLISENKRVISELFPDYRDWAKKEEEAQERRLAESVNKKPGRGRGDGDWMNIFDTGDEQVRSSLGRD